MKRTRKYKEKERTVWTSRVIYFDQADRIEKTIERTAKTKAAATDIQNETVAKLKRTGGNIIKGEKMTFDALVDHALSTFYAKAERRHGLKTSGVKSHATVIGQMKRFREFFGQTPITSLRPEDILKYKEWRLETVKFSTIHRELAVLRKILRHAFFRGWMLHDVFTEAKAIFSTPLIDASLEQARENVLSHADEQRLLDALTGTQSVQYTRTVNRKVKGGLVEQKHAINHAIDYNNPELRLIIMIAVDAGMRRGEILAMKWTDIDFERSAINILSENTKTERTRKTILSGRCKLALEKMQTYATGENVFSFASFQTAWESAKKRAGISDLRFHDLRRTAITRWVAMNVPMAQASKMAGHADIKTTAKYYIAEDAGVRNELIEKIDRANASICTDTAGKMKDIEYVN